MKTITLINTFHNKEARVRPAANGEISAATVRRVQRKLCGAKGCMCGGNGGVRGGDWTIASVYFAHDHYFGFEIQPANG